jgi:hypothetical protein
VSDVDKLTRTKWFALIDCKLENIKVIHLSHKTDVKHDFALHLVLEKQLDHLVAPIVRLHRVFHWHTKVSKVEPINQALLVHLEDSFDAWQKHAISLMAKLLLKDFIWVDRHLLMLVVDFPNIVLEDVFVARRNRVHDWIEGFVLFILRDFDVFEILSHREEFKHKVFQLIILLQHLSKLFDLCLLGLRDVQKENEFVLLCAIKISQDVVEINWTLWVPINPLQNGPDSLADVFGIGDICVSLLVSPIIWSKAGECLAVFSYLFKVVFEFITELSIVAALVFVAFFVHTDVEQFVDLFHRLQVVNVSYLLCG